MSARWISAAFLLLTLVGSVAIASTTHEPVIFMLWLVTAAAGAFLGVTEEDRAECDRTALKWAKERGDVAAALREENARLIRVLNAAGAPVRENLDLAAENARLKEAMRSALLSSEVAGRALGKLGHMNGAALALVETAAMQNGTLWGRLLGALESAGEAPPASDKRAVCQPGAHVCGNGVPCAAVGT